jgi:hypothetical protein
MTKHDIAIEIDETKLASYTETYLAMCWHIAQHNPAPHGDYFAGQLAERTGREIIRPRLKGTPPELWHHQGRHTTQKELSRLASYQPGDGYTRRASFGDDATMRAFHCGRWVPRPDPPGGQS